MGGWEGCSDGGGIRAHIGDQVAGASLGREVSKTHEQGTEAGAGTQRALTSGAVERAEGRAEGRARTRGGDRNGGREWWREGAERGPQGGKG